jgi:transcriptional regulator with XRE-family HTH domain
MASRLSQYLRDEITRRGWLNKDLAQAAGLKEGSLSYILNNPTSIPRLDTLQALATALDVPLTRLIQLCGYPLESDRFSLEDEQALAHLRSTPLMAVLLGKLMDMPDPARRYLLVLVQSTDWDKFVFLLRSHVTSFGGDDPDSFTGPSDSLSAPLESSSETTGEA